MPVDPTVLEAMSQRLADQLTALASGQDWLDFLNSSRHFHRYSPQNQMLLLIQGAQGHVAGYRTWQRIPAQGGGTCQVRKDEKGLVVLAPMTITRREVDDTTGQEVTVTTGTPVQAGQGLPPSPARRPTRPARPAVARAAHRRQPPPARMGRRPVPTRSRSATPSTRSPDHRSRRGTGAPTSSPVTSPSATTSNHPRR